MQAQASNQSKSQPDTSHTPPAVNSQKTDLNQTLQKSIQSNCSSPRYNSNILHNQLGPHLIKSSSQLDMPILNSLDPQQKQRYIYLLESLGQNFQYLDPSIKECSELSVVQEKVNEEFENSDNMQQTNHAIHQNQKRQNQMEFNSNLQIVAQNTTQNCAYNKDQSMAYNRTQRMQQNRQLDRAQNTTQSMEQILNSSTDHKIMQSMSFKQKQKYRILIQSLFSVNSENQANKRQNGQNKKYLHQNGQIQVCEHQNGQIQMEKHQNDQIQMDKHQNGYIQLHEHLNGQIHMNQHQNGQIQIEQDQTHLVCQQNQIQAAQEQIIFPGERQQRDQNMLYQLKTYQQQINFGVDQKDKSVEMQQQQTFCSIISCVPIDYQKQKVGLDDQIQQAVIENQQIELNNWEYNRAYKDAISLQQINSKSIQIIAMPYFPMAQYQPSNQEQLKTNPEVQLIHNQQQKSGLFQNQNLLPGFKMSDKDSYEQINASQKLVQNQKVNLSRQQCLIQGTIHNSSSHQNDFIQHRNEIGKAQLQFKTKPQNQCANTNDGMQNGLQKMQIQICSQHSLFEANPQMKQTQSLCSNMKNYNQKQYLNQNQSLEGAHNSALKRQLDLSVPNLNQQIFLNCILQTKSNNNSSRKKSTSTKQIIAQFSEKVINSQFQKVDSSFPDNYAQQSFLKQTNSAQNQNINASFSGSLNVQCSSRQKQDMFDSSVQKDNQLNKSSGVSYNPNNCLSQQIDQGIQKQKSTPSMVFKKRSNIFKNSNLEKQKNSQDNSLNQNDNFSFNNSQANVFANRNKLNQNQNSCFQSGNQNYSVKSNDSNRSQRSLSNQSNKSQSRKFNKFIDTVQPPSLHSLVLVKDTLSHEPRISRTSKNSRESRSVSTCKKSYQDLSQINMYKIVQSDWEQLDQKSVKRSKYIRPKSEAIQNQFKGDENQIVSFLNQKNNRNEQINKISQIQQMEIQKQQTQACPQKPVYQNQIQQIDRTQTVKNRYADVLNKKSQQIESSTQVKKKSLTFSNVLSILISLKSQEQLQQQELNRIIEHCEVFKNKIYKTQFSKQEYAKIIQKHFSFHKFFPSPTTLIGEKLIHDGIFAISFIDYMVGSKSNSLMAHSLHNSFGDEVGIHTNAEIFNESYNKCKQERKKQFQDYCKQRIKQLQQSHQKQIKSYQNKQIALKSRRIQNQMKGSPIKRSSYVNLSQSSKISNVQVKKQDIPSFKFNPNRLTFSKQQNINYQPQIPERQRVQSNYKSQDQQIPKIIPQKKKQNNSPLIQKKNQILEVASRQSTCQIESSAKIVSNKSKQKSKKQSSKQQQKSKSKKKSKDMWRTELVSEGSDFVNGLPTQYSSSSKKNQLLQKQLKQISHQKKSEVQLKLSSKNQQKKISNQKLETQSFEKNNKKLRKSRNNKSERPYIQNKQTSNPNSNPNSNPTSKPTQNETQKLTQNETSNKVSKQNSQQKKSSSESDKKVKLQNKSKSKNKSKKQMQKQRKIQKQQSKRIQEVKRLSTVSIDSQKLNQKNNTSKLNSEGMIPVKVGRINMHFDPKIVNGKVNKDNSKRVTFELPSGARDSSGSSTMNVKTANIEKKAKSKATSRGKSKNK